MNIQMTLAARYLAGRKLRTFLTTMAIVFGVLVVFGMNSLIPAFVRSFQANILAAAGQVDATITLKSSDVFEARVAEDVAGVDGVRALSGYLDRTVNLPADYFDSDPTTADAVTALSLVGLDPVQAETVHAYSVEEGRFLAPGDRAAAVISASLADAIGIELDEEFTLPAAAGETVLTVVGILPARAAPGNEEILVPLAQAQAMLDMPGKINTIEVNYDSLDEGRRAEIEGQILTVLGDTYQIGALAENSEMLTNLRLGQTIFSLLGVLALVMGGFIIFNTFRTLVAERRRDIGMLRALGASRRTIFGVILSEGLVQGLAGTAVGLLLGYVLAAGLIAVLSPFIQQFLNISLGSPEVSPWLLIGTIVLGVGVTLAAGLVPAMGATQVTPLEALRPTVVPFSLRRLAGAGFWTGVVLIALAAAALISQNAGLLALGGVLFVVGLILAAPALVNPIANFFSRLAALLFARGGTAQLAEGNLSRQPTRAAITASTTLIALAIVVMAASLVTSTALGFRLILEKSLGGDFLLIPPSVAIWGSNVGASPALGERLRAIEGVEAVSALRFAPSQVEGLAISVMGIDPVEYPRVSGLTFIAGDEAAYASLATGRTAIINGILASTAGIRLNDEIALVTPAGEQTYRVVGIATDYLNAKIPTSYIAHANIGTDFGRTEDVFVQINAAPQANLTSVEYEMRVALADYPQFRLVAGAAYIEENLRIFDAAFAGLVAMVIFLAVPSLIAMVNTLAIGVIERTREIGMLRAVGATRRQVRTIILAEAVILAAIGTAFGVLAGLYLGYMVVETLNAAGFPVRYVFPDWGLLLAIAAGLLFGVLAAIIPARQATRLEIVQALRYE